MKEDIADQLIENRIKGFSPRVDLEKRIMDDIDRHEQRKVKNLYRLEIVVSVLTIAADVAALFFLDFILTRFQLVFYLFRIDITALRLVYYALLIGFVTFVGAIIYVVARWDRDQAARQPDAALH